MTATTKNEGFGFYGTIGRHCDADVAWAAALLKLVEMTDGSAEGVRWFLDSTHGRHFADEVVNHLKGRDRASIESAIDRAAFRYDTWKIGRRMSRETGIPAGLPYLTGLVANADMLADEENSALPTV